MAQLPTVEDVAALARVSRQTVSNVMNTPARVKESTRTRVLTAIAELGYRPHASARRLRTRRSSTLGVRLEPVNNGISGSVLDTFLHALTELADQRGLRILLYTAADATAEIEQIRRLRDGADVDAFVLTSTSHSDPRIGWLVANDVPFVTFGRPWGAEGGDGAQRAEGHQGAEAAASTHPWVDVDGRAGVREATQHLLDLGHRRVGFIGWPSPSGAGDDRLAGWEDATRAAGVYEAGRAAFVPDGVESATAATLELLAGDHPPDALVCASDSLAFGALLAARARGLFDLPVIGYDNTPVAAAVGMSSVAQPLEEVAAAVLDLLLGPGDANIVSRAIPNEEPRHRLLAPRLVARGSLHLALDGITGSVAGNHNRKESL